MHKCPNGHDDYFERRVPATAMRLIGADGAVLNTDYVVHNHDAGAVRCCTCDARAEWIDVRQVELFPVAPTLEDGFYTDDDDMRVHAPAEDQMDTYANLD